MGGKTGTTTQSVAIPKEVLARYNSVNKRAEGAAATPFKQYSSDPNAFVAGINKQQQTGIAGLNEYANAAQPAVNYATKGLTSEGFQQGVQGYMNPFLQNAMGSTAAQLNNVNRQQQQQMLGSAIGQGAFGGDRANIGLGALENQQNLALGSTLGNMASQGYQAASQNYLTGMGQLANTALQGQQAGMAGAQAQLGAGTLQQQTEQAGKTAMYNQFQQEQSYPFQVAQFLANIAEGTGALSGNTTTTTQPMSIFSDRRLKEDIRHIGNSKNGLPIYKFKYKGDPTEQTHIGYMADEVEKIHPEAVGLSHGYKTVDYDRASRAEGGAVNMENEGMGYGLGGREHHAMGQAVGQSFANDPYDPYNINNLVSKHATMSENIGQHYVPIARQLMAGAPGARVPGALPVSSGLLRPAQAGSLPPSALEQGLGAAETGQKIAKLFENNKKTGEQGLVSKAYDWATGKKEAAPDDAAKAAAAKAAEEKAAVDKAASEKAGASKAVTGEAEIPQDKSMQVGAADPATMGLAGGATDAAAASTTDEAAEKLAKTLTSATGGRIHRDIGGKTPEGLYSDAPSNGLDIPDDKSNLKLDTKSNLPGAMQDPTMSDIMKIAAIASKFASGGMAEREHHDGSEGNVVGDDPLPKYLEALGKIESSGNYGALGPTTKRGDRAYGKYQVMGANVPEWTRTATGTSMAPEDFLANKEAQEAVAKHYFGQALKKYGTPQDAASVWFTGRPLAKTSQQTADITGTTVPKYLQRFNKAAGLGQTAGIDQIGGGGEQYASLANPNTRTDVPVTDTGMAPMTYGDSRPKGLLAGNESTDTLQGGSGNDTLEPPKKTGVSPVDPKTMGWTNQAPGAMDVMANKMGIPKNLQDSSLWIPLLSGVGTMLSSHSPYLLPAIGEGLVGAASAYPKARQAQADFEQTRTGTMATQMAATHGALESIDGAYYYHVFDAAGNPKIIPLGEYNAHPDQYQLDLNYRDTIKNPNGTGLAGGTSTVAKTGDKLSAPVVSPTGVVSPDEKTKVPPTTTTEPPKDDEFFAEHPELHIGQKLSPDMEKLAKQNAADIQNSGLTSLAPYSPAAPQNQIYSKIHGIAEKSHALQSAMSELVGLSSSLPSSSSAAVPGPLTPIVKATLDRFNQAMAALGLNGIEEKKLGDMSVMQKTIHQLGAQAAAAGNQEAAAALDALEKQWPDYSVSPIAARQGFAQVLTMMQKPIDKDNFFQNFQNAARTQSATQGDLDRSPFVLARANADSKFEQAYKAQYQKEQEILQKWQEMPVTDSKTGEKISYYQWLMKNGATLSKAYVKDIANAYKGVGVDMLRYIPSIPTSLYLKTQ